MTESIDHEAIAKGRGKTEAEIGVWLSSISPARAHQFGNVPDKYKTMAYRALTGKCSPRQAIKAKCLECCCWVREEVRVCGVATCPLNPFRPYQESEVDDEVGDALA